MNSSSARQYFYQDIQHSNECINLAKASLYIAQEEYPYLDTEEYVVFYWDTTEARFTIK